MDSSEEIFVKEYCLGKNATRKRKKWKIILHAGGFNANMGIRARVQCACSSYLDSIHTVVYLLHSLQ